MKAKRSQGIEKKCDSKKAYAKEMPLVRMFTARRTVLVNLADDHGVTLRVMIRRVHGSFSNGTTLSLSLSLHLYTLYLLHS